MAKKNVIIFTCDCCEKEFPVEGKVEKARCVKLLCLQKFMIAKDLVIPKECHKWNCVLSVMLNFGIMFKPNIK